MRRIEFANEEFYHVFNRGTDKRAVFLHADDVERFFQSMREFNTLEPIGSIYENSFRTELGGSASKFGELKQRQDKLVNFICYCLNPNHYHFILQQVADRGIEKFMHRLGTGYTRYFNQKNRRSGVLFQGAFQAIHIASNDYLLHLSAYVNLNDRVHQLGGRTSKLMASKSSWNEYVNGTRGFCEKGIILGQFNNAQEYKQFSESSLRDIRERKEEMKELLLEELPLGGRTSKLAV